MRMNYLLRVIQDEISSEEFLRSVGIIKTFSNCSKCNSRNLGMIRRNRWKCYFCNSEWSRRNGSILSHFRMRYSEFLLCMKFFELELTAELTAIQLSLDHKTVQLLFNKFRSLLVLANNDKVNFDKQFYWDKDSIYLVEEKGRIFFTNSLNEEETSTMIDKKIRCNYINFFQYHFELAGSKSKDTFNISKSNSELYKFMRYAKRHLQNIRGITKKNFLLRLNEIVFRFNNRERDLFDILTEELMNNNRG
jgi:transposase